MSSLRFLVFIAFAFSILPSCISTTNATNSPVCPGLIPRCQGWHSRAVPYPSKSTFTPTLQSLSFMVRSCSMADADGLVLALFEPNIAVAKTGHLLLLQPEDFNCLTNLASITSRKYKGSWDVKTDVSCQSTDLLCVPVRDSNPSHRFVVTSVSAYIPGDQSRELEEPEQGFYELPDTVAAFFDAVHETYWCFPLQSYDQRMIARVKAVIGDLLAL
ncbi:hypothetical protein JAAARDRAFT_30052 [Jaapia argillacea MUCL 33604]|uniref:Uncharacterized protein n=1 Tax=Jaapia argillacea MUCL 33604 TaxID=933084 RepID=A0A067Q585_9AGAM|nr:hypothetical protein JAAARDRAFT_30052 [Jaapia argillacea MUCL 33604]